MTAAPDVFRAIADPTRRAMLAMLRQSDRSVRDLQKPFRMSQPAVSQHLAVLRDAGLVEARRDGRARLYRVNSKPLEYVYQWVLPFVEFTDPFGHVWRIAGAPKPATQSKEDAHGRSRRKTQ